MRFGLNKEPTGLWQQSTSTRAVPEQIRGGEMKNFGLQVENAMANTPRLQKGVMDFWKKTGRFQPPFLQLGSNSDRDRRNPRRVVHWKQTGAYQCCVLVALACF